MTISFCPAVQPSAFLYALNIPLQPVSHLTKASKQTLGNILAFSKNTTYMTNAILI